MKKNGRGLLLALIVATLTLGLIAVLASNRWFIIPTAILGIITILGTFTIPNNPKNIAVITKLDTRTDTVFTEGLGFLLFKKILYNYILVDATKKNIDFAEQILITPNDNVTTKAKSSMTYAVDEKNVNSFLNINGEDGLKSMIEDIEEEKLREWARSPNFGPMTWEQLSSAKDEAIKIIIAAICGVESNELSQEDEKNIKKGTGNFSIPHLGIQLIRYNIKTLEPFGEVYEASIAFNKEKKERKSENYEVETDYNKAIFLRKKLKSQGVDINIKDALKQIMEWKIEREANKLLSLSSFVNTITNKMKGGSK